MALLNSDKTSPKVNKAERVAADSDFSDFNDD